MAVKKGLRNPLDEAQVRKAVVALQSFVAKQRAERPKQPLVEAAEPLSCIITRKVVPAKGSIKPIPIDIPHSLHGEEGDSEICLFVKDEDKQRIKEALAADPVKGLTKVMTVKKLRKHFSRFEDKRTLAGAYDMFLADDRVLPYLKAPLGTKFFVKKKQPMSVRVSRKNVSSSVRAALRRTAMHVSTGACSNVKVALLDMPVDHIVENIMVAMNNCSTHIPKNWGGIQSISVKTNDSIALPIFNALSPLSKLPPVGKTEALTKRKLEEVEAEVDAESVEEPAKKKAKKHKKEAETKTEVKAEEPSNKKAKKAVKKVAEPAAEEKNVKKHKKEAEPVVEEKKSKKAKKAAEPAKEETPKKAKKAKKEAEPVAEEKKAKKQKVKHDEPAATEEAPKKAKKAKKDAPVEADKQKKKRKAGKN